MTAISDTHSRHSNLIIEDCDFLLHAGDFSHKGSFQETMAFLEWFERQPAKHKILTCGNHDFIGETSAQWLKDECDSREIWYLNDDHKIIDGLSIYGSPISPTFGKWAFNRDRGLPIKKHWDLIPEGLDVLITHCTSPIYKTLMSDLSWKMLGDLKIGDELLAFDEYPSFPLGRKYKKSVVKRLKFKKAKVFRVLLSNGDEFIVTENHMWLGTYGSGLDINHTHWNRNWLTTKQLKPENVYGKRCSSKLRKAFNVWNTADSYKSGYLAGIFDGEGHLSTSQHYELGFTQNSGKVLTTVMNILDEESISFKNIKHTSSILSNKEKNCRRLTIQGDIPNKLEFLGKHRPKRLIEKFMKSDCNYRLQQIGERISVLSVEPAKDQEILEIETTTGTLIIDGYPMHNSPPYGILDKCPASVGCQDLLIAIEEKKPLFHVFGHIHEGAGTPVTIGETTFINASMVNRRLDLIHKPVQFRIYDEHEELHK